MSKRITVLGATGYTGKLICEEFESLGIGFQMALRNLQNAQSYSSCKQIFQVNTDNLAEIQRMLDQTDILINCVGPFNLFGKLLIEEVRKRSIYYLDITGEQSFVKSSYDDKENKACLIHSCSFESAIADLMAYKFLNRETSYESIQVIYDIESTTPSPGTRFTMKVHSFFEQFVVKDGEVQSYKEPFILSKLKIGSRGEGMVAYSAPYPEVLFFSKNFKVKSSESYTLIEESMVDFAMGVHRAPSRTLEQVVQRNQQVKASGPKYEDRINQKCNVYLLAKSISGAEKTFVLACKDMYAMTASLIVFAAKSLLNHDLPMTKVLSPAEAFYTDGMLESIVDKYHLNWDEIS